VISDQWPVAKLDTELLNTKHYAKKLQNINAFVANQDFPFDDCIDYCGFGVVGFDFDFSVQE
jgi:hypothetical protein